MRSGHHPRPTLRQMIGKRIAPPRFIAFLVLFPLAAFVHHHVLAPQAWTRSLAIGFDVAAAMFLISLVPLLKDTSADAIRKRADANDAGRVLVLTMTVMVTLVVMAAIAGELPAARSGSHGAAAQLIVTLTLIWLFSNAVYALHYAHDFYSVHPDNGGDCGGLDFPGTKEPGYLDFVYFAFTLGMTFQTSDTAITATRVRAVVTLHSFASFLFNIGVIAFTINALGGGS